MKFPRLKILAYREADRIFSSNGQFLVSLPLFHTALLPLWERARGHLSLRGTKSRSNLIL